jgi:hypothetical protein
MGSGRRPKKLCVFEESKEPKELSKEETDKLIELLKKIISDQGKELEEEKMKSFSLMSEVVRLRRVGEILGEDRDEWASRAEKAERGLRNLRRWMQISGMSG